MVKLIVRDRETIQEAVRRFRKLVETQRYQEGNASPRVLRKAQ